MAKKKLSTAEWIQQRIQEKQDHFNSFRFLELVFNRNGNGNGVSFWAVRFIYAEPGLDRDIEAIATLFRPEPEEGSIDALDRNAVCNGLIAVTILDEEGKPSLKQTMSAHWFEEPIRKFIASGAGQFMAWPGQFKSIAAAEAWQARWDDTGNETGEHIPGFAPSQVRA